MRASQRVFPESKPRGAMKVKAGASPAEVGSRPLPGDPGAPPARLARSVGEVERERVR